MRGFVYKRGMRHALAFLITLAVSTLAFAACDEDGGSSTSAGACCKHCGATSKACGNSCIANSKKCTVGDGCACD